MTPQERVEAYIRDWHQCWMENVGIEDEEGMSPAGMIARIQNSNFFDDWHDAITKVNSLHWSTGSTDQTSTGFSSPPTHDPHVEKVRRVDIDENRAVVETILTRNTRSEFFEFKLIQEQGLWKIQSVVLFFHDEHEPAFSPEEMDRLLALVKPDAQLLPPEHGDEPNCEVLFEEGRIVKGTLMMEEEPISVRKIGRLSISSGAMVAADFTYSSEDARPLSLRVQTGDYDVEICQVQNTVAAVRVVFDSGNPGPFDYRQASRVEDDGSSIGVDGGNVAICDAVAFMSRSKRTHARDIADWGESERKMVRCPLATFLTLGGYDQPSAVIVQSGHGDGGYPAYWVFDALGKLVAFVVDFLIVAEFLKRTVQIPWRSGVDGVIFEEPNEAKMLQVRIDRSEGEVALQGGEWETMRWLSAEGEVVVDSEDLGSWNSSEGSGCNPDLDELDSSAHVLEIVLRAGYRNSR